MKRACELICMALCLFAANGFSDMVNCGSTKAAENMGVVGAVVTTNTASNGSFSGDGSTCKSAGTSSDSDLCGDRNSETNGNTEAVFEIPQEELADVNLSLTAKIVKDFVVAGESTPISSVYKNSASEGLAFAEYINGLMTYKGTTDDSVVISFNPEGFITRHSDGAKFGAVTVLFSIKYEF